MDNETPIPEPLTNRETEVLACLIDGLSNSEIAERLFLASSTVKWYINQLNQKLGTRNREEIIKRALRLGLLGEDEAEYATARHNLPHQTTPFVGRHTELDQLYTLLTDPNVRLVTILAPGGMGKTRLALEAAQRQLRNFKHGVYFVPLQALSDSEHIIPPIATSTGYQFNNDGRDPKQQVLNYLANKQMLLIFDNFEHVLEGSMLLIEILQNVPDVKILATSREKLSLSGESVYSLRGMQFPNRQMSDALEYGAVKLLTQAAKRVKPDWWVTEANVGDVVRLCQLTQGMPLGIVLAAAWLDVYSLGRICDEIEQSADILQTDMRDVPERLRSIRAVFDYSWERLQPSEQQVFMKMSVFRGGCTPRAAEHITGANRRILHALVNKALLTQSQSGRYDIHELLRQYAEVHLEAAGEAPSVRDTHMAYYVDAVHKRKAEVRGPRQLEAFNEIETDFENVRAAWQWAVKQRHYVTLRRTHAVLVYSGVSGRQQDILELLLSAFEQMTTDTSDVDEAARGWLEAEFATFLSGAGRHAEAEPLLRSSLAIASKLNDRSEMARCLHTLSWVIAKQGRLAEALSLDEESLRLGSEIGDQWRMARVHSHIGYLSIGLGYPERGYEHTLQAYQLFCEIGDRAGMAGTLTNLGAMAATQGKWDLTEQYRREALALQREIGYRSEIAWSLTGLAGIAFIKGDFEEAEQLTKESLAIARDIYAPNGVAWSLLAQSRSAEVRGNYEVAHQMAHEASTQAHIGGNWSNILDAKLRLGWTLCCLNAFDDAIDYLLPALEQYLAFESVTSAFDCIAAFAQVVAHQSQHERAAELLGLVFEHPIQMPWLGKHPRLTELRHNLQAELGEDAYNAAWERGRSLDLDAVARELLAEFGSETSE